MDNNKKKWKYLLFDNMFNATDFSTRISDELCSAVDGISVYGSWVSFFTVAPIFNDLSDHEVQYHVLEKTFLND